jgi:hypothetical protein
VTIKDTPIHRKLFVELTLTEQDQFLHDLRERRLLPVRRHAELITIRKQAKDDKTLEQIDKVSAMLEKAIDGIDKAVARAEGYALKAQALRIQIEGEMF